MRQILFILALGFTGIMSANVIEKQLKNEDETKTKKDDCKEQICRTTTNFISCGGGNGGILLDDTTCGNSMEEIKACEYKNYWLLVEFFCGQTVAQIQQSQSLD